MNLRKLSLQSITLLNVVLFVAVIVASSVFFKSFYKRFDVTSNKAFSLSEGTIKLVRSLKDVLHLKVYMSADLPSEYAAASRDAKDVFEEFRAVGGRNVNFLVIDPGKDESLKSELNQMGILELRFNVRKKERFEQRAGYFSAAILYRNRKEIIRNLTAEGSLELAIVRAIKKLTSVKTPKIAYVTSFGTEDLSNSFKGVYTTLIKTLDIERIDFSSGKGISEDVDILFLAGPRDKLTPWALYEIDQFLMRGGKLVAFVNRVRLNDKMNGIINTDTELEKLLAHYGISVNQDMICDYKKMGHLVYTYGRQQIREACPAIVMVDAECFKENLSAVTKGLQRVYLPWCSSISLDEEKTKDHKVEILLKSSKGSTVQHSPYNLDPKRLKAGNVGEKYARNIGVLISGSQTSFFKGKDIPASPSPAAPKPGEKKKERKFIESTDNTYIAVVGSSYFGTNNAMGMLRGSYRVNMLFIQNLFDYLSLGNDLIGIRMKSPTNQKVNERVLNDNKTMLWILNIALMPIFILLLGVCIKLFSYFMKRKYESMVGR